LGLHFAATVYNMCAVPALGFIALMAEANEDIYS
jgi:hypothetical protein